MDEATFNKLLEKIRPRIKKQSIYKECISARDKLIITLRYLATGESYRSLMYNYRISESTISLFVPVVCKAIYDELEDEYLHKINPLPSRNTSVPHVIVADAAFSLSRSILKPYPFRGLTREQRILNYRLSRARWVVENTFGILANRANPEENIDRRSNFIYGLSRQNSNRTRSEVIQIRDEFKEYVNGCGSVPWQNDII
ncbi:hypothetical protein NQ314_006230 [Rhamnusium bicolor]|uniref:DDE Tnp4 domain-containing protein n=1 Tax=Rhamnusium bicolor TaxID=1586634 RepID=A0AAV8Z8I1_9CUCU|nr:hypothetical protein NQ314_006230 [Rhamnusium bicolor]